MNYYGKIEEADTLIGNMGVGVDYYKGETGAQGIPGKDGKDGKTPIKGVDYYTDEEIASIKDEIAQKVQVGAKGEDGKSAYQIAVDEGFEGSEADWLASLKGTDGRNGIDGINGTNGKDGINGIDGKTPVKGVDYFTAAEIEEIEQGAADKVDTAGYAKSADLSTVATSGSYEDLTNKPTIPDAYELPTASATTLGGVKVGSGLDITNGVLSATGGGVADAIDWSKVQNKPNFANVATSGDYNDLINQPTIPSVEGLASETYVNEKVAAIVIPEVPTKVSELENDKGYLTEHQSLEGYAKTADLAQVAKTGSYNDLADKPTIPSTTGLASTKYVDDKVAGIVIPTVPTKVSAFENDKGYVIHKELMSYISMDNIEPTSSGNIYRIYEKDIAATYDVEDNEITTTYAKKTEIPTVPTNVSAFTNDAGYLTEHQSLVEYAKKTEIPAPYTLPTASTSTLGGVKVDGNTITITDGVISAKGGSGGAEPDAYIKDASVSGNTLTLTKKDNTNVVFTPSGGSSGGSDGLQRIFNSKPHIQSVVSQNSAYIGKIVYDYNTDNQYLVLKDQKIAEVKATKNINPASLLSTPSNFNQNKDWVLQWIKNNSYNVYVDGCPVIDARAAGARFYYYWINNNEGLALNQGYISFKDSTQKELADYNNQQSYNQSNTILITASNWQNYITVSSSGSDWQFTQDQYNSDLYNAKELVVCVENTQGNRQMGYFNFGNGTLGGSQVGNIFYFDYDTSSPYISYNGTMLDCSAINNINYILYKT